MTSDRPRRILVADDDPDLLELVCLQVERAGFEPIRARDGEEALRLVASERPAMCLLDVMMPRLTGIEVVERMRNDPGTEHIPVLLLTATVQEATVAEGVERGADGYLRKPFKAAELQERIRSLLGE